jgi:nitrilase
MTPHRSDPVQQPKNARIAAVQMISTPRVDDNLRSAARLVAEAVAQGAQLVALPEYFPIMGMNEGDKVKVRESDGRGPIQDFLAETAERHAIWLIGGSIPLMAGNPDKVLNSSVAYSRRVSVSPVTTRFIFLVFRKVPSVTTKAQR